jgi:hypothetical protein
MCRRVKVSALIVGGSGQKFITLTLRDATDVVSIYRATTSPMKLKCIKTVIKIPLKY